ncbi:restriction endonuclease subunit S [Enterobacter roggenkampii]|uniref:restriction endonuclease subunit S n=1 Tax=Enterobacter roggenkampii TaxID=1812935 RepID=UPI0020069989|nr:restriction endonuclease subunit S [Enterobacter roggenkampii]MCK6936414.1 restriction endonuclease subunit S [Enterobacter roggenkampii]
MAKYKAYPEYKDSGVEWLGEIPIHWNRTALKRLCSLTTGLTPPTHREDYYAEEGHPWIRPEDLNEHGLYTYATKYVSDTGWNLLRHIKPNSTLVCCIGTIGKCGYVEQTVSTNQQVTAATFHNSGRYYFYLFKASRTQLEELATGNVLKILNSERLGALSVVKVDHKEADSIAKFLDYETIKIDNLIEKQLQLIELLKEKRQAVISHAVTKGLNPDVPMKDSGVEWLGKIPTLWNVCHLKYLAKIRNGQDYKSIEADTGFPVIGSGGQFAYAKNYLYDKPSVLLGRKGTIDKPLYMDSCFWAVDTMFYTEVNKNIIAKYLYYISTTIQFDKYSTNTALPSMTQENLGNYSLCYSLVPNEQQNILDFIELKTNKIDTLIQKQLQQIELLKERRTALIAAAVTGKIDLRDWTPPASSTETSLTAEEATA